MLLIFSAKIRFPIYWNFYIDRWQIDALVFVTSRISCMAPLAAIPLNVKMIFQRSLNAWQVNCTTFCFWKLWKQLYYFINVWCPILILTFIFQLGEITYLVVRRREFLIYVRICVLDRIQSKPMMLGVRFRVRHIQLPHWFVLRREWVSEYFNDIM